MLFEILLPLLMADDTTWQWSWGLWGLTGLICLIPLVFFIISILLCIWVYRDAESRGMSGPLWLIIILITGIIGLIIYMVIRKDKAQSKGGPPPPP